MAASPDKIHLDAAPGGTYGPPLYAQPGPPADYQPQASHAPQSHANIGESYRNGLFAQCAQGIHQPSKKYGVFGIIVAVVCFPCGLIALFVDVERKCDRCGIAM
ncbi:hypothetical protein FB451DRAFT_1567269 [Mycena latifolia]|nr:hypothetical protein FB451DRAFT_1567269 [Mycena latifolia]